MQTNETSVLICCDGLETGLFDIKSTMDMVSSYQTIQRGKRRCEPVEIRQDSFCLSAAGDRSGILRREPSLTRSDMAESFKEAGWKTKNSDRPASSPASLESIT